MLPDLECSKCHMYEIPYWGGGREREGGTGRERERESTHMCWKGSSEQEWSSAWNPEMGWECV